MSQKAPQKELIIHLVTHAQHQGQWANTAGHCAFRRSMKRSLKNNWNIIRGLTQVCWFRDHSQKLKPRFWQVAKKKAGSQTGPNCSVAWLYSCFHIDRPPFKKYTHRRTLNLESTQKKFAKTGQGTTMHREIHKIVWVGKRTRNS